MNAMNRTPTPAPPGWYPDPKMAGTQRYWDGAVWTTHAAPAAPRVAPARAGDAVLIAGWLGAVLLPIVGFVLGLVAIMKGSQTQGVLMMVVSVASFVFWLNALAPEPVVIY